METAEFIADHPVIVKELHERTIGDAREDFWLKQYEDHDFRNPGGESLNQVKVRMKTAIDSIVGQMEEGETALVVSHATAICAYLLSYCEIEVKDAENKVRKISFHGKEILNGRFQPADGFEILFENDIFGYSCYGERKMKTLYLIGGTMGVGKTTVSQQLKKIWRTAFFLTATGAGTPIRFR